MDDRSLEQKRAELKALQERRDRIALTLREMEDDADHWNRLHPNEEPLIADVGGQIAGLLAKVDATLAVARATPGILES